MALDNHLYYTTGFKVVYPEGDRSLERQKLRIGTTDLDQWHIVKDGDNLSKLASRYYGDSQLWYLIADANEIFNPFDDLLETGVTLRIPGPGVVDKFNNNSKNVQNY